MNLEKNQTVELSSFVFPSGFKTEKISSVREYTEKTPMDITVSGSFYTDTQGVVYKNCGSHSIEYIKKYGLKNLVNLNTRSKPAKTASVLTGHLNTFLASMQAYYAGALGLGYINVLYAPLLVGMSDKDLHQVAQELIFNGSQNAFSRGGQSLHPDELIWVKENGQYKSVRIGEFVDTLLDMYSDRITLGDGYEKVNTLDLGFDAISFDRDTYEVLDKGIAYVARMPHKGSMYKIHTTNGIVNVTGDHSLFKYDVESRKVVPVKASLLKEHDRVVAPCFVPFTDTIDTDRGFKLDRKMGEVAGRFCVTGERTGDALLDGQLRGTCIDNEKNTEVPGWLFNAPVECKQGFIEAVFDRAEREDGYDAYVFPMRMRKFVSGLMLLLLGTGDVFRIKQDGDNFIIWADDDPEEDVASLEPEEHKAFLNGHLTLPEITKIEEYDYDGYVYDISVPGTEAFVGGVGNLQIKNTLFLDFNIHTGVPSYLVNVPAIGPGGKYMAMYNGDGPDWHDGEIVPLEETTDNGHWVLRFQNPYREEDTGIAVKELDDGTQWMYDAPNFHVLRYGDYQDEARRFAMALLQVWEEGDADGHVFEFPKCDFHVSAETFTDAEQYKVYQKACEVASQNGSTYFVFDRDAVSLASCCFSGDTRVYVGEGKNPHLMTFEQAWDKYGKTNRTVKTYDRGTWRKAKVIRLSGKGRRMLDIAFGCGKHLTVTADHEFPTNNGVKKAYELTPEDAVELSAELVPGHKNCYNAEQARILGALAGAYMLTGRKERGGFHITTAKEIDGTPLGFDDFLLQHMEQAGYHGGIEVDGEDSNGHIELFISNPEIVNGVGKLTTVKEDGVYLSDAIYREDYEARFGVLVGLLAASAIPVEMSLEREKAIFEQIEAVATTVGTMTFSKPTENGEAVIDVAPVITGVSADKSVIKGDDKEFLKVLSVKESVPRDFVYCFSMLDTREPFFTLPSGIVTHNCRLKVQVTDMSLLRHPERLRTLGFQNVTINIPQCAYRAKHRWEKEENRTEERLTELFLEEIDSMMDICKNAHIQKRAFIETLMQPGRPMWQMGMPANDGKPYINLDTAVYIIGMLGVNDAIHYLTGKEMHESDEAMDYALKVISHMFLRTKQYTAELGWPFKLEESPAESAARRLAKADLVYYRDDALTVFKGTEDAAYYTNSIHLAAAAPVDLVERIRKQSMFHSAIESGAIIHAFIGEEHPSPGAIEELIRLTFLKTQCAQLVLSPEFTYCQDCGGKQRGLVDVCDQCGSHNVIGETRVVGYYSRVQNFNKSKRYGELVDRHRGRYKVEEAE